MIKSKYDGRESGIREIILSVSFGNISLLHIVRTSFVTKYGSMFWTKER